MTPAELAEIHASAFAEPRPWTEAEFAALLAQANIILTGGPDCFAMVRIVLDEAELLTIATRPGRQRRGLATAVMRRWMAEAADRGATSAFLDVAADNGAARALYEACGFGPCGLRRGYYKRDGRAIDAVLMSRPLP